MSKAVKINIYKTMVKPAVVFGSGTVAMAVMDMTRLGMWERKIWRRVYGPLVEQGMWWIWTDQELREQYKDLDVAADINTKILEWTGRTVRMD